MDYQYIRVEQQDFKLLVTLNRPEKRNAFTPTMVNELYHIFLKANVDDTVKVVLIQAEGPVFCAGMDLKTFENSSLDKTNPAIVNINISLGEVFDKLLKPSIALVEGNVIAGAFLIVLGCTYAFSLPEVKFRLPELSLGIFPFQVMASLLKVLPEKKVLQLCLDTQYFDVPKALSLGIIDGLLVSESLKVLIDSFRDCNVHTLKSGIQSLRMVQQIPYEERFLYLKASLDNLKRS